jgi:hypothetical protein
VIGTYAAAVAVCGASLAIGQAAIGLCGARRWSWLAPAVGLALLCAICWATVRLPGHGVASAAVVLLLVAAAVACLCGRVEGGGEALRVGAPVGLAALVAASLPFAVEGHFGILGTGFNPDMSQHLLATDRLAHGAGSQLLHQGYPLGPHAIVVALDKGLGIGLVQGFSGLTVAVVVLAPLTALAAFADRPPLARSAAALVVGLPYLVASYFAQGAFKEVIQALLVLAFVLALRESARTWRDLPLRESARTWRDLPLRFVPAAAIAIGSVYAYSFPGLIWLVAIAVIWTAAELVLKRSSAGGVGAGGLPPPGGCGGQDPSPTSAMSLRPEQRAGQGRPPAPTTGPAELHAASLALTVFLVGTLPELGRMIDFHNFETFAPNGPGLGNLFGQISPFEALGIWPSGDFRLAPGDGAAPAFVYYLGAAFGSVLLVIGLIRCWRRNERAVLVGLLSVAAIYIAARLGGTPYTAAKALAIAAPICALTILLPLSRRVGPAATPAGGAAGGTAPEESSTTAGGGGSPAATGPAGLALLAYPYLLAAGACSLLAFANAPIGPTAYSSALTGLRPLLGASPTLVLAPQSLLAEEHGERYLVWELRGGRVCIESASAAGATPPPGVRFVITADSVPRLPFPGFEPRRHATPYLLWERRGRVRGRSDCPLIAVRQARQGPQPH